MRMRAVIVLLLALAAAACRAEWDGDYTVGYGTPSGNVIWIRRVVFDDRWSLPGGGLSCCWEEAGALALVFDWPLPRVVEVEWLDESERRIYEARVELAEDLARRAGRLKGVQVISSGRKREPAVYLIIGFREGGEVVVWLSNAPYKYNVSGRVLEEVGRAHARRMMDWTPGAQLPRKE